MNTLYWPRRVDHGRACCDACVACGCTYLTQKSVSQAIRCIVILVEMGICQPRNIINWKCWNGLDNNAVNEVQDNAQ